jgi:hypothetical protein
MGLWRTMSPPLTATRHLGEIMRLLLAPVTALLPHIYDGSHTEQLTARHTHC